MSEIQVGQINSTDGSTAITTGADGYVSFTKTQIGGRRNLIINGAMQVAQRGNTSNDNGVFVADRFQFQTNGLGGAGAVIAASTQSTVVPSGFASALKTNVTTAGSGFSADNRDGFTTALEHQDITHLIDAGNSFTLSFWVRSSLATTYGLTFTLADRDTSSTGDRYATSYTINAVDTWEKKTVTIPAPTSSRSGGSDNGTGIVIYWNLEMISGGSRSSASADAWEDAGVSHAVVSSAADTGWMSSTNDFYITGVQLEVGTVATPFEHISFGEQLALCQRYYQRVGSTSGDSMTPIYATRNTTDQALLGYSAVQCFRSTPTVAMSGSFTLYGDGSGEGLGAFGTVTTNQIENRQVTWTQSAGGIGAGAGKICYGSSAYFEFDAEL